MPSRLLQDYAIIMFRHAWQVAARRGRARIGMLLVLFVLSGCGGKDAEIAELKAENEHLKARLRELQAAKEEGETAAAGKPALDLTVNELWTQRFDDNQFRAKQRLDGKTVRVTGPLDSLNGGTLTLLGESNRFGPVSVSVSLDEAYLKRVLSSLEALNKGMVITAQGQFVFERMRLENAQFIRPGTSEVLSAEALVKYSTEASEAAAARTPKNK